MLAQRRSHDAACGMRMGCMLHGLIFSSLRACMRMQVHCAINRATKEKRVAELEEALRNSTVAFGVRFNKVSVRAVLAVRVMCTTLSKVLGCVHSNTDLG